MRSNIGSAVVYSFLLILFLAQESTGDCPKGKIDDFAFCCCKKISVIQPSSSFTPSLISATIAEVSSSPYLSVGFITPTATSESTIIPTASVANTTVLATPTPVYRGDACFHTDVKYGYYNECYCNETRYNYVGFNNSNGYYTEDGNATDFDYKCWNLPRPKLYIAGMFNSETDKGKQLLVAADMAIDEINKNDAILPGYKLVMLGQNSTQHAISKGSAVLLDYLAQSPKKVAIIGPDDDDLAKTVAAIASLPRYKLLQISYGTSAIDLSMNHEEFYKFFFRTKPFLDLLYNAARIEMLQKYAWGKIALIYSNDDYYRQLNANLRTQIQASRISINTEEDFVSDPWTSMKHLKERDIHVILGSFSGDAASRVLCSAYKLKMYGPRYVYLFIGYTILRGVDGCTLDQVRCAARYQFFFKHEPIPCVHHFVANYTVRLNQTFFNTSTSTKPSADVLETAKYTYDAVTTIANVLHKVDPNKSNSSKFYLNYDYGSMKYGEEFRKEVLKYDQCGASDNVSFSSNGNRYFKIGIVQILFGGGDRTIGWYDEKGTPKLEMPHVQWPGNNQPYQEIRSTLNWRFITKGLYIAYCIFAAFGILFAIFCLVVLIWRRKHKEIRYSFYLLNIIIIIGCILVYISVFLFGVDNVISPVLTVDRVCRARLWVFSIGFVLAVGGLIAKLWIAQNVLSRRLLLEKQRRRRIMFAIVFAIFLLNLIFLLCWHFIDPLKRVIEYIKDEVNFPCDVDIWPDNPFVTKLTAVEQCKCGNDIIWYFIMCIWKVFLLIVAVYWAYQTRHVYIPTINDTQRCGICAYVITACTVIGFIIAMTTRLLPDVFYGLVGFIILVCVTAVLIILFLHKILLVFSCTRNRVLVRSATEQEDDQGCFSRCLSKCNCFGSACGCCSRCCKGNCPKCFLCLAVCCAPCLACCAPLLACCSMLFGCCGSSCRSCCCGPASKRNGTEKAGEQKFIVRGIGDDKSAELARLQRELEMKNLYIQQLKRTDFPEVRPIWTQTMEPVILLSDTCDDDTDDDGDKEAGGGKNRKGKKRHKLKVFSSKMDFSHIQSRTDSNYKNGEAVGTGKGVNKGTGHSPSAGDKGNETYPPIFVNTADSGNKEEIAKLKNTLAERDAEIERLKNGLGRKNEFEMQEIDESVESSMKMGLVQSNKDKKESGKPSEEDLDKLICELDSDASTPRGIYDGSKGKMKIYNQKLDWSQIPSKLRLAGMVSQNSPDCKGSGKSSPRTNKVSPSSNNSSSSLTGPLPNTQSNTGQGGYQRRTPNFKIFNERIDYSSIKSKIKPMLSNDQSRASFSSADDGSVRILNAPSDYNKKQRNATSQSGGSLNKPDKPSGPQNGSRNAGTSKGADEIVVILPSVQISPNDKGANNGTNSGDSALNGTPKSTSSKEAPASGISLGLTLDLNAKGESSPADRKTEKAESEVKVLSGSDPQPKPSAGSPLNASPSEKPSTSVKILNDPKDYSHVKSKLVPDPPAKSNPDTSAVPSSSEKPSTSVKILNDPKDYSHVKSKLVPDPPAKSNPDTSAVPSSSEKPSTSVKILNDPKDYSHVKSKLTSDQPAKSNPDTTATPSPRDKPNTNVKILNDPKDYSHVRSKLVPDPPPKPSSDQANETSPRDKGITNVRVLNDPKSYNHIKSRLSVMGPPPDRRKSSVRIVNRPADYSHVKSKLP